MIRRVRLVASAALATLLSLGLPGALAAQAAVVGATKVAFAANLLTYSAVSPDGTHILYSDTDGATVQLLDTATNTITEVSDPDDLLLSPEAIVFSPDGLTAYISDDNARVVIVDVVSATVAGMYTGGPYQPSGIGISPDGGTLYVSDYSDGSFWTYSIDLAMWNSTPESVPDPYNIVVSADGSRVYNIDVSGIIDVLNADGDVLETWSDISAGNYPAVCTSPDGSVLYLPSVDTQEVWAFSLADGSVLAHVENLDVGEVLGCAVSPDGSKLYLTDHTVGGTDPNDVTAVTEPGIIHESDASTLEDTGVSYRFDGVASTALMNFFDECNAYVAGWYGNAQVFDACTDPSPDAGAGDGGAASTLASTGVNGVWHVAAPLAALTVVFGLALAFRHKGSRP